MTCCFNKMGMPLHFHYEVMGCIESQFLENWLARSGISLGCLVHLTHFPLLSSLEVTLRILCTCFVCLPLAKIRRTDESLLSFDFCSWGMLLYNLILHITFKHALLYLVSNFMWKHVCINFKCFKILHYTAYVSDKGFGLIAVKTAIANIIAEFEVSPCAETPHRIELGPKILILANRGKIPLKFKKLKQ